MFRRLLGAVAAATLSVPAGAALASPAHADVTACTTTSGVLVIVDMSHFGDDVLRGCASGTPSSGVAALQSAGFSVAGTQNYGLAFVCRINGLPSATDDDCVNTPPPNAYWAYYYANAGDTTWHYSSVGASSFHPEAGSIQAWAFGADAKPG